MIGKKMFVCHFIASSFSSIKKGNNFIPENRKTNIS